VRNLQGILSFFLFFSFLFFSFVRSVFLIPNTCWKNVRNQWLRLKDYTAVTFFIFHAWDPGMVHTFVLCFLFFI
jgi:hypothetical protein